MEASYERTTTTKTYNVTHTVPPHSLVITRTSGYGLGASPGGSSKTTSRTYQSSSGGGGGDISFTEGQYAMVTATGVNAVKESREKERSDMNDLNDRFANYIEKVHYCVNISVSHFICLTRGQSSSTVLPQIVVLLIQL